MQQTRRGLVFLLATIVTIVSACGGGGNGPNAAPPSPAADTDPPEVQVGDRLFVETRFAQFFFANSNGE